MTKLEENLRKNLERRMAEEEATASKPAFSRFRTMVGLNVYRLKMKLRITWLRIRSIWATEDVQAAGIMVGVNATTGMISVKMVMQNGDECICAMDADGADHLASELNMAVGSVSMR